MTLTSPSRLASMATIVGLLTAMAGPVGEAAVAVAPSQAQASAATATTLTFRAGTAAHNEVHASLGATAASMQPWAVVATAATNASGLAPAPSPASSSATAAPTSTRASAPSNSESAVSVAAPTSAQQRTALVEPRHVRVGRRAMARLRYVDISSLGWSVEFHAGRDGFLGMADGQRRVIDIWVRDDHSVSEVLATLAHEMVHALDFDVWTDAVRDRWLELRGVDLTWWPSCTCDDRDFGAGDIAEAVAMLEAGRAQWTGRNGVPTQAQLNWLRSML